MSPIGARSLVAAVLLSAGCGYTLTSGASRLPAGAEHVFVRPFENHTSDPEAGALVAAALREELARRGVEGRPSSDARIEGEVVGSGSGPSSPGNATYAFNIEVAARLVVRGKVVAEQRTSLSQPQEYLGAIDAVETEGRRRLALRRAAAALARDLVDRFEAP